MDTTKKNSQSIEETQAPADRILARRLARELSKEELEAVSGGMMKDRDVEGTGSGVWGNLDD